MKKLVLIALTLLTATPLMAGRRVMMYPLTTPVLSTGGSQRGVIGLTKVTIQNISNKTQNVSVTIDDEKMQAQIFCPGGAPGGAWTLSSGGWYKFALNSLRTVGASTQTHKINPYGYHAFQFSMSCDFSNPSGLTCDYGGGAVLPRTSVGFDVDEFTKANNDYIFRLTIEVAEDLGAVHGTVYTNGWVDAGASSESSRDNFPINAGRPF